MITQYSPVFLRRAAFLFVSAITVIFTTAHADDRVPNRPNILLCIADDWGFANAGAYGCPWVKTPGFDRVAREGLLFNRAYTPNAKCAPSRACIITGRNSWQLGAAANHWCYFPPEIRSYPEALAQSGYFVGFTGKGWAPGIANDASGKPRQLTGKPYQDKKSKPPTTGISNVDYAANFEEFLNSAPKEKPWCFWYGAHEPHRGYEFGSGVKLGHKKLSDIDRVPPFWPDNDTVRNDMLDYAFEVEHYDRHLAHILDLLEKRGQLDNTLIVATSDHGMPFPRDKGQEYEWSNHIPLAIMWKAAIKSPGRKIDDYVSFIDLAPTFIQAAGLQGSQTGMLPSPGHPLQDIFDSPASPNVNPARDHILIGKERHDVGRPHDEGYPIRGIIKGGLLYLQNFEPDRWPAGNPETGYLNCDGGPTKTVILNLHRQDPASPFWALCFGKRPSEEFYNIKSDPDCMTNLAGSAQYESQKKQLQQQLLDELKSQQDPRMFGQGHLFDEYPYADPSGKGFYERYMKGEKPKAGWVSPTDFEKPHLPQNP